MAKVTFIAETYEAISLLFFLRLILTYMGGKKETRAQLKDQHVALNSPPLCCLFCLPHIKFSKRFLFVNEMFVIQLAVLQLVLGYIDLLIGMDIYTILYLPRSTCPADLVTLTLHLPRTGREPHLPCRPHRRGLLALLPHLHPLLVSTGGVRAWRHLPQR